MLRIAYGKFKQGKQFDFVEWFTNEEKLKKFKENLPEGLRFIDAYLVDGGQADHHFEIVYEMDGYAVLDKMTMDNPTYKAGMESFLLDMGMYTETFAVKFVKSVSEVSFIDRKVFDEIVARDKANK